MKFPLFIEDLTNIILELDPPILICLKILDYGKSESIE